MLDIDPSARYIWLIVIAILVVFSGLFSASETALTSCSQFKIKVQANDGDRTAKLINKFITHTDISIITILIGNNFVATIISTISTVLLVSFLAENGEYASLIATIIITIILYIFGDTIPKILARSVPDKFIRIAVYPLVFFYIIFLPITYFFYFISLGIRKTCRIKQKAAFTEEEFTAYIDDIEDKGLLDEDESEIIQNAVDFMDTSVRECFTPLDKIEMININGLTNLQLNAKLSNTTYSRIPVYDKDKNNIIGILNVKKYFNAFMDDSHVEVRSILTQPFFVEPSLKLDDIFKRFQNDHIHIALIKNNESIIGMITMEDILEELVGEIAEPLIESKNKENK